MPPHRSKTPPAPPPRVATVRISAMPRDDHLAVIKGGDGGKARPFGDHEAQQQFAVAPKHLPLEKAEEHLNDLGRLHIRGQRSRAHPLHDRRHGAAHELLKQGLLVLEVKVKRALGDARLRGNVVEPRRLVTAARQRCVRAASRMACRRAPVCCLRPPALLPDCGCVRGLSRRARAAAARPAGSAMRLALRACRGLCAIGRSPL